MSCQLCGGELRSLLHLGMLPPVNKLVEKLEAQTYYPLHLGRCKSCKHVQLMPESILLPQVLFPPDYPYRSGVTKELLQNFKDLGTKLQLPPESVVVDIGGNDGSLLDAINFCNGGFLDTVNIEPTQSGAESQEKRHEWIKGDVMEVEIPEADAIVCCNAFAHIPEPHKLTQKISDALKPGGTFVIEVQYVGKLVYDTIYHEHLRYYSVEDLARLFAAHQLKITRIEEIPTHGGSIRVWAQKVEKVELKIPPSLVEFDEKKFLEATEKSFRDLWPRLLSIKSMGGKIVGVGAPSRAATFLCYTGAHKALEYIVENEGSPKLNKYMPGTGTLVVAEDRLLTDQPEWCIILAWHLAPQIMRRLRSKGYKGKFIVPLPEVKVHE